MHLCNFDKKIITTGTKVKVRLFQSSVVTQTVLGGLSMYPPVANFLQCVCAKNYESWLAVDKVIATIK